MPDERRNVRPPEPNHSERFLGLHPYDRPIRGNDIPLPSDAFESGVLTGDVTPRYRPY